MRRDATPGQTAIDFENPKGQQRTQHKRAADRRAVELLQIESPPADWRAKRPGARTCKAVLLYLDNAQRNAEGWRVKAETMAAALGFRDRGAVQRALAWLEQLGYVERIRTGRSSMLSLNRAAIAAAVASQSETEAANAPTSDGGRAHIRRGPRPHQMGAAPTSTLEDFVKDSPPSTGEGEICRRLTAAGCFAATAREIAAQVDPAAATAVLEHFAAHPGAWGPGALVGRLRALDAEPDPAAGWPEPDPTWKLQQTQQHRRRQLEERRREVAAAQAAHVADRSAAKALEDRHGPHLDRMPEAERDELARRLLSDFVLGRYRAGAWQDPGSYVRTELLEALEAAQVDQ